MEASQFKWLCLFGANNGSCFHETVCIGVHYYLYRTWPTNIYIYWLNVFVFFVFKCNALSRREYNYDAAIKLQFWGIWYNRISSFVNHFFCLFIHWVFCFWFSQEKKLLFPLWTFCNLHELQFIKFVFSLANNILANDRRKFKKKSYSRTSIHFCFVSFSTSNIYRTGKRIARFSFHFT